MSQKINDILKALTKELGKEVNRQMVDQLRKTYVEDITAIVKDCLNRNELYSSSGEWITIKHIAKKYHLSLRTVGDHCTMFKSGQHKIERKWIGRHNMINEKQFIAAFDYKARAPRPAFLNSTKKD